jgi:ParB-like chromosome segregation protein Spo0J
MTTTDMLDAIDNVPVDDITVSYDKRRPLDHDKLGELTESIRQRGLLQPIGVQRLNGRYRLIWGAHRFEAWSQLMRRAFAGVEETRNSDEARAELNRWMHIPAVVYPADLPEAMLAVLEIEENLRRKELSIEEKAECTMRLAAALKELKEAESRHDVEFTEPTTGRGHKGIVQQVAEREGVAHTAIRHRAKVAEKLIDEPVDLAKDKPAELTRKADKMRQMSKAYDAERKDARKRARQKRVTSDPATLAPPDLVEMVQRINTHWSPAAVEAYQPTEQQLGELKAHLPDVIRKLQSLAARFDIKMPDLVHSATLTCEACGQDFARPATRGRKPSKCPECRTTKRGTEGHALEQAA